MIDMLASERQFAEHLVPIWRALPEGQRGSFLTADNRMMTLLSGMGVHPVLLTSKLPDRPVLVASVGDLNRLRRLRRTRVAYVEHGCGQSYAGDPRTARHPSYAGGPGRDACAFIMAPNEVAAARWQAAYPAKPVHVIGATRLLPAPDADAPPLLALSFHWSGAMPEMMNALAHYRKGLRGLAHTLPVIGHAHPRFAHVMSAVCHRAGIKFVPDLAEVARRATVYAADNTSTLWELGRTRPIIVLNAPWYRRWVEHGLRFWSHIPGIEVSDAASLLAVSRRLLDGGETTDEEERRRAVVGVVIPCLDGAERAARLLSSWEESLCGGSA